MTGLFIILAVLFIGIGYAAVSNVTLTINGNARVNPGDSSFNVHFPYDSTTPANNNITGAGGSGYTATAATEAKYTGLTTGIINAMDFTKKDEYIDFPFVVKNDSTELSATIASGDISISAGNNYLQAELAPGFTTLTIAAGSQGTVTIRGKCLKTPTDVQNLTNFTVTITANPTEAS
jgi:hypothetical protein